MMVAILLMVALVLDLSVVRQSRQANKSAADFAVTAGLHGLETPTGIPLPWGGVCAAIEYLKANHEELGALTGDYKDGDGDVFPFDPCASLGTVPHSAFCKPGDVNTWAWFSGTANGGRMQVDIRSGYTLGGDLDFPEDTGVYSGDNGDALLGGCDQLAVILRERDPAFFGRVAGASEYGTAIRTVGRVQVGSLTEEAVALLLLEQKDCESLVTSGNNTFVWVRATPIGAPTTPGLIRANSDATGACGSAKVLEGSSNCPAVSSCVGSGPSIVAEDASPLLPGRVSVRAAASKPGSVSTPSCASSTAPTGGCTVAPVPTNRGVVTRAPVDTRYLAHARALKITATSAGPGGYFVVPNNIACAALATPIPVSTLITAGNPKVYLNCDLSLSPGQSLTFDDSITDVVVNGSVDVKGTLIASNVRNFFVRGAGGVKVSGTFRLNERGFASCAQRFAASRSEITKFVVLNGPFDAGSSGTEVDLCNTFLFLAQGTLPPTNGTAPSNNGFTGTIQVGSSASLDWRAPNQTDRFLPVDDPLFAGFEDMALWTEFSGNGSPGSGAGIGGQGAVVTTGVFFLPNANPFNIAGGGSGAAFNSDAQFIVRKMRLSGTVGLTIVPNPHNAIPTPVFEAFGLIR